MHEKRCWSGRSNCPRFLYVGEGSRKLLYSIRWCSLTGLTYESESDNCSYVKYYNSKPFHGSTTLAFAGCELVLRRCA
jgi:hypothetical protein